MVVVSQCRSWNRKGASTMLRRDLYRPPWQPTTIHHPNHFNHLHHMVLIESGRSNTPPQAPAVPRPTCDPFRDGLSQFSSSSKEAVNCRLKSMRRCVHFPVWVRLELGIQEGHDSHNLGGLGYVSFTHSASALLLAPIRLVLFFKSTVPGGLSSAVRLNNEAQEPQQRPSNVT